MITRIQARNYRSLRDIDQELGPFHVLVGPNGSGKSTFLDVVAFLGDFVREGLEIAIEKRTSNFYDLLWMREGKGFELAIEARVPEELRTEFSEGGKAYSTIRYEVKVALSEEGRGEVEYEVLSQEAEDGSEWSHVLPVPRKILFPELIDGSYPLPPFTSLAISSGLGLAVYWTKDEVPPAQSWLVRLLTAGIQYVALEGKLLQNASPPAQGLRLKASSSNLPWVVEAFKKQHPDRFRSWINHLQTSLPDLEAISTIERPEDRHRYFMVKYKNGVEVPSWMVSEGTLRLMALTLPAYLKDLEGIFLIEEPENGMHPQAIETVYQSLSSMYDAQVLVATHSPALLAVVEPKEILCFDTDGDGATTIVRGDEHPILKDWKGEVDLGTLFAAGVMG